MSTPRSQSSPALPTAPPLPPGRGGLATGHDSGESVREETGYGEAWRATLAYWLECGLLFRSGDRLEFPQRVVRPAHPVPREERAAPAPVVVPPQARPASQPPPQSPAMQGATPHAPATQQPFQLPAAERQKPLPAPLAAEDRLQRMHALAATVASCQQCRLSSTRTQTVFGVGTPLSDVVFVGEGPGAEEDLQGEPFVGAAGKLLDQMLKAIQRQRAEVYIANVVKCRPPGNRNPEDAEMLACHTYLFQQLEIIQPKVIFCLGKFAILCLTGHTGTVSQARENAFVWRGIPVLASFHPAYYLRTPSRRRAAWEDLLRLLARLE